MAEARVISRLLIMGIISLIINSVVVLPIAALTFWAGFLNFIVTPIPYVIISIFFYFILFLFNIVYMVLNVVGSSLSFLYKSSLRRVGVVFLIVINSILAIFLVINLMITIIAFKYYISTPYGNTGSYSIAIWVSQCCLLVYGIIHIVVICNNKETPAGGDSTVISHLFVLGFVSKIVNSIPLVTIATISCYYGVNYLVPPFNSPAYKTPAVFYFIQFLSSIAFLVTNTIAFTLGYQYRDRFRKIGAILLIVTNSILPVFFVINLIVAVVGGVLGVTPVATIAIIVVVVGVCQIVLFVYNTIHTVVIFKSFKHGNRQAEEYQRNELTEI